MDFGRILASGVVRLRSLYRREPAGEPAWKDRLRGECLAWIDGLEEPPEEDGREIEAAEPDLHALFRELAALRTDTKRSTRHGHESTARLERDLRALTEAVTGALEAAAKPRAAADRAREILEKKKNLLPLVELYDRLLRVREQLDSFSVPKGLLSWRGGPSKEKLGRIREGMTLLCERYFRLLESKGVTKRATVATPFDPLVMNGIERTVTDEAEPGTVLEEYSGAYLIDDHLLKSAEVRVAADPER